MIKTNKIAILIFLCLLFVFIVAVLLNNKKIDDGFINTTIVTESKEQNTENNINGSTQNNIGLFNEINQELDKNKFKNDETYRVDFYNTTFNKIVENTIDFKENSNTEITITLQDDFLAPHKQISPQVSSYFVFNENSDRRIDIYHFYDETENKQYIEYTYQLFFKDKETFDELTPEYILNDMRKIVGECEEINEMEDFLKICKTNEWNENLPLEKTTIKNKDFNISITPMSDKENIFILIIFKVEL